MVCLGGGREGGRRGRGGEGEERREGERRECVHAHRLTLLTRAIRLLTGQTPLHLGALCGSQEVMKLLVNAKADVDIQDSKSGKTALHYSVERGDLPMTGYLVTGVRGREGGRKGGREEGRGGGREGLVHHFRRVTIRAERYM